MIEKLDQNIEKMARHIEIFERVIEEQPIGIVNLSRDTGIPHHHVRYSLRQLENQELIEPTNEGAVPTDKAKRFIESHDEQVDELISKLESLRGQEELSIPEE